MRYNIFAVASRSESQPPKRKREREEISRQNERFHEHVLAFHLSATVAGD